MTWTTALSGLLILALGSSGDPVAELHQRKLDEHYHHLSHIAHYSCHHPQPRTVPVHELLSPYQTRGKAFFPEVTVLHRCDVFSGCCEGGHKCGPVHAHNVHLPFKVTYLEDMGEHHKGDWEMEYYYFDNHTICGCDHYKSLYNHIPTYHEHHAEKEHHTHEIHEHKDDKEHLGHIPLHKDHHKAIHEEHHEESHHGGPSKKIDSLYITI